MNVWQIIYTVVHIVCGLICFLKVASGFKTVNIPMIFIVLLAMLALGPIGFLVAYESKEFNNPIYKEKK